MSVPLFIRVPWDPEMNLGRACNKEMALLPKGSWAVLLDHDMLFTTKQAWWHDIQAAIACRPDAGVFGVVTNRIAAPWQQAGEAECHDMLAHYEYGETRARDHRTLLDVTDTRGFGGVVIVIARDRWEAAGGFVDGMLCVDHQMQFAQRRLGRRNYLIESVYVYHRRRAHGGELPPTTPKAAKCPCRGPEPTPTIRVRLP